MRFCKTTFKKCFCQIHQIKWVKLNRAFLSGLHFTKHFFIVIQIKLILLFYIPGNYIATNFCTCNGSVQLPWHVQNFVAITSPPSGIKAKLNSCCSWIMRGKWLVKWSPGSLSSCQPSLVSRRLSVIALIRLMRDRLPKDRDFKLTGQKRSYRELSANLDHMPSILLIEPIFFGNSKLVDK